MEKVRQIHTRIGTVIAAGLLAAALTPAAAQTKTMALDSADGLKALNASIEPVTHRGKKGIRVTGTATGRGDENRPLAVVEGLEFQDGTIEVELAGLPNKSAGRNARGFVGVAFRMNGPAHYDNFYLRPTNGRSDDQLRRNHSAQYTHHPDFPWNRLRKETPGKYESYVDLVPGEWTKVKIVVKGEKARLYVHGNEQPTLIVNDVKSGASGKGSVALWLESSTEAYFRNLKISQ